MRTMRPRGSRARDGFIKNFDHRQMGSRMEALVYSETHDDEEERETEKIKKKKKDERDSVDGGTATQRPLKLLAIYLRNSPLYGSSGLCVSLLGVSEYEEYNILRQI